MQRTYYLSRASRLLCWLEIALVVAGAAFFARLVVFGIYQWSHGRYVGRPMVPVFCIPFFLGWVAICVAWSRSSWRKLKFSVALSDEGVQVGNEAVPWDWIDRVDRSSATIVGPEFAIHTWKGRLYRVPCVERASQLEDTIRAGLIDGDAPGADAWERRLVQCHLRARWSAALRVAALVFRLAYAAGFAMLLSHRYVASTEAYMALFLLICVFMSLSGWAANRAAFSIGVFNEAIRIGDEVARWDEIERIERVRLPWVAFRVRTRDGRKLNVYSGLENVRELEGKISTTCSVRW